MSDSIITQLNWYMIDARVSNSEYQIPSYDKKKIADYLDLDMYETIEDLESLRSFLVFILWKKCPNEIALKKIILDIIDEKKKSIQDKIPDSMNKRLETIETILKKEGLLNESN